MLYNLQYRDLATLTTTTVTGIDALFYDLAGLTPSTQYEFRVQEDDGGTTSDYSDWSGFTTAATPQDIVAIQLQQITEGQITSVSQLALLNGVVASQGTNSETGAVAADFDIQTSEAEQTSNSETGVVAADFNVQISEAQQITNSDSVGVISDIAITTVTAEQLTNAEVVDLLSSTGLSVVVVEQGTDLFTGEVTIINTVASVSAYQATESESVRTGDVALITVVNAEQLTEARIAEIIGSAMMVNPRSLRVKRTTVGYTVNRKSISFNVTLKNT